MTPPERPALGFTLTPVNLLEEYEPPAVGAATPTRYTYTLDRDPESVIRPDGQTVTAEYDAAGRLERVTTPTATLTYAYDPASGKLTTVTAPDATLGYAYDGPLPTEERWTGAVSGRVGWTFDPSFRVVSESVNGGTPITFQYDPDSLLTRAGALTLTRHAANGVIATATPAVRVRGRALRSADRARAVRGAELRRGNGTLDESRSYWFQWGRIESLCIRLEQPAHLH